MRRQKPKQGKSAHYHRRYPQIPMVSLIHTLAVAEHLSFHRAALALGTSQSSVSARIKALEADLGVVLFDRNTRGVRLTGAGRRFVNQVRDAMGILDHAVKTATMQARGDAGELRIGVHALMEDCFLDRLLKRFHVEHPGIHLHITEGTARDAQILVREGRLDVAFMACTHEIPDLNSRVIWRDRLMVALPVTHLLASHRDVEWRQIAGEVFLIRHGGTGPQVHDLIVLRSAGKWPVPTVLPRDVGRDALLSMIAAGHGISIFAEDSTTASTANVVFLPIRDEPETTPFSAVWLPSSRDPALANLLKLATVCGDLIRDRVT
ncbi:LysR family transcriptional regulator [Rhizobium pusense]|uniref:LysR family transcriptional regulator n=1 Tax=Agrobacterium pusense TaxID=648995 RepID=UPI00244C98A1|nr:LysR family transcriptional regulator [Agrobacterium pusense]MDH1268469.1 LysR family transcriptional regulator [Agrobacterium pusense]